MLKSSPQQSILASSSPLLAMPGHSFPISSTCGTARRNPDLPSSVCGQPGTATVPGFGALCILPVAEGLRSVSAPGVLGEGRSLLRTW